MRQPSEAAIKRHLRAAHAAAFSSAQVLYVGDHIFTDVNMAKRGLSWRTCMILQELELEVEGLERGRERTLKLQRLFRNKDEHSAVLNFLQTKLDGRGELDEGELVEGAIDAASGCGDSGEGDDCDAGSDAEEHARLLSRLSQLRASLDVVESEISGLLWDDGAHVNRYWGYTTRAGFADKSHLMRQIEKYADIYTSRVSNFLRCACGDAPRTRKAFARPHICAALSHRSLLLPQVHAVQALHLRAADAHPRPRGRRLPLEGERVRRRRRHRLLSDPDGRCGTVYSRYTPCVCAGNRRPNTCLVLSQLLSHSANFFLLPLEPWGRNRNCVEDARLEHRNILPRLG